MEKEGKKRTCTFFASLPGPLKRQRTLEKVTTVNGLDRVFFEAKSLTSAGLSLMQDSKSKEVYEVRFTRDNALILQRHNSGEAEQLNISVDTEHLSSLEHPHADFSETNSNGSSNLAHNTLTKEFREAKLATPEQNWREAANTPSQYFTQTAHLLSLPPELLLKVLSLLPLKEVYQMSLLCKFWYHFLRNDSAWKVIYLTNFGAPLKTVTKRYTSYKEACIITTKDYFKFFVRGSFNSLEELEYSKLCWSTHMGHFALIRKVLCEQGTGILAAGPFPIFRCSQYPEERPEWVTPRIIRSVNKGDSALHTAARYGHLDVAKVLLEFKVDPNVHRLNSVVPLFLAAQEDHPELVELLVENSALPDLKTEYDGATPLFIAAQKGNTECAALLMSHSADPNVSRIDGTTPMHIACQEGHLEVIQCLVDGNAIIDAETRDDCTTPLWIASQEGHTDVVKYLLAQGASTLKTTADDNTSALFAAAQYGRLEIAKVLLEHGSPVDMARNSGATPLYAAAQEDRLELVKLLAAHGANLEAARHTGATPLYIACQRGHARIAEYLISKGAYVRATLHSGTSLLFVAAQEGHLEVVELLLSYGCNIEQPRDTGATSLFIACQNNHIRIVEILLSYGANPNVALVAPLSPSTPLMVAANNGYPEITRLLLHYGARTDVLTPENDTPRDIAVHLGHRSVVKEFDAHAGAAPK